VTQTGLATTRAIGAATLNASAGGKIGTTPLSVTLVPVSRLDVTPNTIDSLFLGDSLQLVATARDSAGGALLNRSVTWRTSDSTKATVTAAGLVRTHAAGSFAITAESEGKAGGIFLNVQFRAVALFMPDSLTIGLHHAVRLIPDLRSESGTHLSGRVIVWSSSNATVVEATQDGVLIPHQLGSATVVASSGELSDRSLVIVTPEPVASIVLRSIATTTIADTTVEAFEALPYDRFGLPTVGDTVTWTSSDTAVVRIAPSPTNPWRALLTGLRPGTTRITVTSPPATSALNYILTYPLARFIAQPDSMTIVVGGVRGLEGVGVDRFGNRLSFDRFSQIVTSADTAIARIVGNAPAYIEARQPGRTTVEFLLSNGLADTVPIIVPLTGAPRLYWRADFVAPYPYTPVKAELVSADSMGALSSVPRDVRILSTDTTVAFAIPSSLTGMVGQESITVSVRRPGFATLTAVSDSQFASLFVTVYDLAANSLILDSTPSVVQLGESLHLHATVIGPQGVPRPYPVTWTTSDAQRATVSDSGIVATVGVGDVTIIASSGARSDTAVFTILSANPPAISSVSALPLVPGALVTFTGSGFDPEPASNTVLIDSAPAVVTSASETELTVMLPPATAWRCTATHRARVLVSSGGRLALDSMPLSVATQRPSLAPGDALVLQGAEAACNELAPVGGNALYVVSAANTSLSSPISFAFASDAAIAASPPAPQELVTTNGTSPGVAISLDSLRRSALIHRRLLEQSRALNRRAGAPAPLLRAARQMAPQRSVTATINGVARVRIPRLEDPDFCSSYRSIDANVVYSGAHVVILEDRNAPLAGTMGARYQALGLEFDNVMYPKLLANFGNPLALDSLLDGDDRIAMVFSPVVNSYGVAGFVVSCDFYPESIAPSSNTGEILYAQVPTAAGTGFAQYTADVWRWLIRSVVMHESKHLTAFAERLSRGAPIEDTWLEEASAVLAEELWSRTIYGTTWKGDAVYRWTVYCDVRPTFPECAGRPYSMFNAWAFLYDYIRQLEQRTPLGPATFEDATFYGSGWSFLRWAVDQSNAAESDFLRQLVQEQSLTGVANLAARTNRPFDEMLSDWSDALYCETWGLSTVRSAWIMPSWKTEDIFNGMNQDFPLDFPDGHPLRGLWPVGAQFPLTTTGLPPGGWALFAGERAHVTRQLLDFSSTTGGPPPAALRVQLFRFR
jgi:uncharacterized protein YjdB